MWGVKGKILCPAGCQNPVARITKAKEILKNPRPAGSWRPLKCIFSGKGKSRSQRAAKPRSGVILTEEGNLLGSAFPKPCYAACAAKKISVRRKVFLSFALEMANR